MNLKYKLLLANLLFKALFIGAFVLILPKLAQRVNLYQTDNELIEKREQLIDLISEIGIEPFLDNDTATVFGSYNLLKEEFISIEPFTDNEAWNFIEIDQRQIDNQILTYRVLNYTLGVDDKFYLLEIGKSLTSISRTEGNIRRITLFFLFLFVFISVGFELFYTDLILKPLGLLINKIKSTQAPEAYNRQILNTSTNDFTILDATLVELMEKIATLLKREKEITQNISHELLTPISILRGKLENLAANDQLDEQSADRIDEALGTLFRLKTLVSSLLLIARIESNQYLKDDAFEVTEVITDIIAELQPMADEKEIQFQINMSDRFSVESGNRSLLYSMFYNIINNAVKFTQQGGVISINSVNTHQGYSVTVADTGQGIPIEYKNTLFDRFKKKRNVIESGTGIGLAIVKSVADFHHITIQVDSSPKGTIFEFVFAG